MIDHRDLADHIAELELDAPKVTMLPKRQVRCSRIAWTCYYCQHEWPKGSSGWVQPLIEDDKFGSYRMCAPNADCMARDYTGEFVNAHIEE